MMKLFFAILVCLIMITPVSAADDVFKNIDKDGSGKIDKQEYLDAVSGSFDKADKNKDGYLSRKELESATPHLSKSLKALDTDKDGRISKEEFTRGALKEFDLLDKNKDGAIDRSEFEAYRKEQLRGKSAGAKNLLKFYF